MRDSPLVFRNTFAWPSALALAALIATSGCPSVETSTGGSGGRGPSGGTSGAGGMAATGGTGGSAGSGGQEPPPPPTPTGSAFDSGGGTIKSDSYEMDVSVGGPVGKGKADSAMYMLEYYVPTSPER